MVNTRLIDLREMRNLKQKEIAAILGIPTRTYGNYESGARAVPLDVLIDAAAFYDTSTDYILRVTDDPRSYSKMKMDA